MTFIAGNQSHEKKLYNCLHLIRPRSQKVCSYSVAILLKMGIEMAFDRIKVKCFAIL